MTTRSPGLRRLAPAAAAVALVLPGTAGAHALLVRSDPADGSRLGTAPHLVRLSFSEAVSPRFRSAELIDGHGERVSGVKLRPETAARSTLVVELPRLGRGRYALVWHTVSEDDGHATSGTMVFGVRADVTRRGPGPTEVVPAAADVLLRWLRFSLAAVLIGGLAFVAFVLRSAAPQADGELVARARGRVLTVAGACGATAVVVEAVVLARQATVLASVGAGRSWVVTVRDLLLSSRWGALWLVETAVLGALVVVALRLRGRAGGRRRGTTAAAAAFAVALATTEALGSHAAALRPASTAVAADAAHVLSASVWMGGVAALVFALWPTPGFTLRDATAVAVGIRRRFAVLAGAGAVVVAITGLYAAGLQVSSVDSLLLTLYGRTLLAKTAVVTVAGAFGACNFFLLRRLATGGRRRLVRATIVGEASVGAAAFLAAGVLTAAAPARGPSFAPPRPVVPVTLSRQVDDLVLTVTVRPNRPGTNTIGVAAASTRRPPPAAIDAVQFRLGGSRGVAAFPRSVGGGGWLTPAALERPGDERLDVVVTRGGHRLVVPFGWRIDPADPARPVVVSSRRLSPIVNRAALLLLIAAPICVALAVAAARPARSRPRAAPDSASRLEGFS